MYGTLTASSAGTTKYARTARTATVKTTRTAWANLLTITQPIRIQLFLKNQSPLTLSTLFILSKQEKPVWYNCIVSHCHCMLFARISWGRGKKIKKISRAVHFVLGSKRFTTALDYTEQQQHQQEHKTLKSTQQLDCLEQTTTQQRRQHQDY